MKIIEVKDLYKSYGDVNAVNGISFDVDKGSLFAFLGVNGAGKSTTINILCGALRATSGDVVICGKSLDKSPEEIKKRIGIVFQESVLDKKLTVEENLRSRAALYGLSPKEVKDRVREVTEDFCLTDLRKRKYGKLSGGQRRRVDIARALLNRPEILFLDEPTTGLDPATRGLVWELLEKRLENGLTVFLTTHYMEESVRAEKIVIIDEGKIVVSGTPDDLKSQFTGDILRIVSSVDERTEAVLKENGFKFKYLGGAYDVELSDCRQGVDFLAKHPEFSDFELLKGNMDDVFLNVTGKSIAENRS